MNTKDGIRLSGTLTMPENPIASLILITGNGPQDRDQLFMGHKTFWVLADYLSRNDIAVLRYDDRGVAQSEGIFEGSSSYDFAYDASAAIAFLATHPNLKHVELGIIGHSEGGLIAPITASLNKDVDFVVLLAGPSRTGRFVSENQMINILLSNGVSQETAMAGSNITKALNDTVLNHLNLPKGELAEKLKETYSTRWQALSDTAKSQLKRLGGGSLPEHRIKMLTGNWYRNFIKHNPVDYLKALEIPVFALFGDKDVQVSAKDHSPLMKKSIAHIDQAKVTVLPNHNHLFQEAETGAMSEYQHIEETLSTLTLSSIVRWITGVKKQSAQR